MFSTFTASHSFGRRRASIARGLKQALDAFNYSGSGTNWSGSTLVNAPTHSDTYMGQFDFNGTSQYVNMGSQYQASRTVGFSLNVWVKFDSLTGWQTFVGQDSSAAILRGSFYFQKATDGATGGDGTSNTVCIKIVDGSDNTIYAEDTTTVTTGVWYNYTATVSSTELKLYRNGALKATTTDSTAMAAPTGDMIAGAGWYNDGVVDYFNGQMSVVQYYDSVLTSSEVRDLYYEYSYRYPTLSDLQLQYLVADYAGSGTTLPDSSGNSYDGTLVNGLTQDGKSLVYNGTDDFVYTPNMYSTFNSTTHFTLEVWYKPTWTVNGEGGTVVSEVSDINFTGWHYSLVEHRKALFGALSYDYAGIWTSSLTAVNPLVTTSGWRQIVLTYDGTNGVSYTNAESPRTVALSRWTPWNEGGVNSYILTLGHGDSTEQSGAGQNYFKGNIGIVRVYNRALTQSEVTFNYNVTASQYGLSPSIGTADNPAVSAQEIYDAGITESGWYYIQTSGMASAKQVYCNMDDESGGWMLAAYTPEFNNLGSVAGAAGLLYPNAWTNGEGTLNRLRTDVDELWYHNGSAQCDRVMKMASTTASQTPLLANMDIANQVIYDNPDDLAIDPNTSYTTSASTKLTGTWYDIKGHTLMSGPLTVDAPGDWVYTAGSWWTVCGPSSQLTANGRSGNAQGTGSWTNPTTNQVYGMANVSATTNSNRTDIKSYAVYIK